MSLVDKILIIEDSLMFSKLLIKSIQAEIDIETEVAATYRDARALLAKNPSRFLLAIVDLHLPDSTNGNVLELPIEANVPTLVLTSSPDSSLKQKIISRPILDYLHKGDSQNVPRILGLIKRLKRNKLVKILIVDDSKTFLTYNTELLKRQKFQVVTAESGETALHCLRTHHGIKVAIIDNMMPGMDGETLIRAIRQEFPEDKLSIIGISSEQEGITPVAMLKAGANDFIKKPFILDEFYLRVKQNLNIIEQIEQIRDHANRDYLTNLYNRRFLFEKGTILFELAKNGTQWLTVVMMDIDHFKRINDNYGHAAGDLVLKKVSQLIQRNFSSEDIICRFGGEEFCILSTTIVPGYEQKTLDKVRHAIETCEIYYEEQRIPVTTSIGATSNLADSLDATINIADHHLYEAKETGRNKVIIDTLKPFYSK